MDRPSTLTFSPTPESGITGLNELSTINQAIGVLITQGYEPDHAKQNFAQTKQADHPIAHIAAQLPN